MIVVFPMLIDNTISSNIIPGICSTLERFIIIYKSDAIMKMSGLPLGSVVGGIAQQFGEVGMNVGLSMAGLALTGALGRKYGLLKSNKISEADNNIDQSESDNEEEKRRKRDDIRKQEEHEEKMSKEEKQKRLYGDLARYRLPDVSVKVGKLDMNATLSLEPTNITVNGKFGTAIIGIKVIPVPVDPAPFVKQLMMDHSGEKTDKFIGPAERKLTKMAATVGRWTHLAKDTNLKLDPFNDIIYARSKYGSNVFCLLNLASLTTDTMFKDIGGMDRIFKMGWNSIIIADDITKRAYFCMKEFGGICSLVNYSFMMSSLHDKYEKSFEKLEDLKKSSSIYFSKKTNPSKILGESYAEEILERFKGLGIPCLDGECSEE